MKTNSAIYVRDVVKKYGDKSVLDGLSMTVERGTIYGFLGSSGCGKTTLLSCIVGRKSIYSGDIWVLGTQKGNGVPGPKVGYMPQELALIEEFTVKDAIYYFGTIFNMKNKEINKRLADLTKLLDLPPENRYLKDCSGGQKRRVSFAAALVHNPELLILDEPTVGIDPILREKIWNYLKVQVDREKITVIITTHYIEEAKEANKIGLMRGGKLLTEESPSKLLSTYQTDSLEKVFLILSQKQEIDNYTLNNAVNVNEGNKISLEPISTATSVESFAMGHGSQDELTKSSSKKKAKTKADSMSALNLDKNRMKALLDKNWKQFHRNIGGIAFLLTFPLMQPWFFTNSVGTDPMNLKLGVVNNESFTTLCNDFDWNGTAVSYDYKCSFKDLTCGYLTYLEHPMITKVLYDSLSDAVEGIKHGNIIGALYIPSNFTDAYEERVNLGADAEKWTTDFGEIKAYMDMSNKQTGGIMAHKLLTLFVDFQKKLFADCDLSEKLAGIPIQQHFFYGDDTKPMTLFSVPGLVLSLVYLLGCTMTSNIIVKEKQDGVWDRSIVAGVSSLEIILAHLILEAAIMFVQCIEVMIMVFFILEIEYVGELYAMFMLLYLEGICGMAYGFFISSLSDSFSAASILCTGGYMPLLLVGGIIWPIEAMPNFLMTISMFLPCTIVVLSFRNIMVKGRSLWDLQVINGVGVTLAWIGIFAVASILIIKIKK